jgi:hypothetical protein
MKEKNNWHHYSYNQEYAKILIILCIEKRLKLISSGYAK